MRSALKLTIASIAISMTASVHPVLADDDNGGIDFSLTTPEPTDPPERTTISPGIIGGNTPPDTPSPPENPTQVPGPSAPGVVITIPIE